MQATDIVPMALIRHHLRLDHDEDDALLAVYAQSALAYCLHQIDQPLRIDNIPEAFKSALLLVLADLYEHRMQQQEGQYYRNTTVNSLLQTCRDYADHSDGSRQTKSTR